ncbi:MAG: hypothetical protein P4L46_23975 [Fimbriimonas sp.]|nr:hypothetical protein [Fimbriimonas sp.]
MNLLGIHLNILIGPGPVATPASIRLLDCLQEIEVKHTDTGRSGFKLVFRSGRSGAMDLTEDPLLNDAQLAVRSRVVLTAIFGVVPTVISDGIITTLQITPGSSTQPTTLEVAGEDLSLLMDLEEKVEEHPAQPMPIIFAKIIASYATYGMIPMVIPPLSLDIPNPTERIPVQRETDLDYINRIKPPDYVFAMKPGPAPMTSTAYLGPPVQLSLPQSAITVNMAQATNCSGVTFNYDSAQPTQVTGQVLDRSTGTSVSASSTVSTAVPLNTDSGPDPRTTLLRETQGMTASQAFAYAQSQSDQSSHAVTVEGEIDAVAYGGALVARGLVGLRGAGMKHDGMYYVKEVTHNIKHGAYSQKFKLTRPGLGTTSPVVVP